MDIPQMPSGQYACWKAFL